MTTKKKEIVWNNLSKIDCNEHTEKKGNLTYLSWAWAWGMMMQNYPDATYRFKEWEGYDVLYYKNGTAAVSCEMTVNNNTHTMWLAVMDHKNQAVVNPTATQISNTKMRCLVKAMAMFGLGHYIYAGEDVPEDLSVSDEERQTELIKLMSDASQVAKLKAVITQQSKWVKSMETKNPEIFHKVHEVYSLKTQELSEGKIANGK
tara:strand:- start:191 stop:799 length:609 start_codon:yes stop_codon:yes gene_type:complete